MITPPNRLLLRSPNWLGDAVMALPAVAALKAAHPGTALTVAAPAKLAALWKACPAVEAVTALEEPRSYRATVPLLRAGKFEMAVLFPNSFRSGFEAQRAGIRRLVALASPLRDFLVSDRVPRRSFDPDRIHQRYDFLHLVAALGATGVGGPYLRPFPKAEAGPIVICPGAAYGPAKRWPAGRFAEVGRALASHGPIEVMGAGSDAEAARAVAAAIPNARNRAGETTLDEFLAAIAGARLVLTNDSGAMHLAAAFGVPGVAIFGSTEPRLTGPIDPCVRVVRRHVPCSPCFERTCPLGTLECMERIGVAEVVAACEGALS